MSCWPRVTRLRVDGTGRQRDWATASTRCSSLRWTRYPLTTIERYVTWTRAVGEPLDPWIRVHTRRGGVIVRPIPESMRITGTVAEWEQWTDMVFPEDGDYVFPRGLAPLTVAHGQGFYWEPNVWIVHAVI